MARETLLTWFASTFIYDSRAEWEFMRVRERLAKGQLPATEARTKLIAIARENPGSQTKLGALSFVARKWPSSTEAKTALAELPQAIAELSIGELADSFDQTPLGHGHEWQPLASVLRSRVDREPDHPRAAKLLATASAVLRPSDRDPHPSAELLQLARLVQERYATSPDLVNFCEAVSNIGSPVGWTVPFEPHVRHILEVNQDRFVQCAAQYALATIVRSGGIQRQAEAKELYEEFLAKFDGKTPYRGQTPEQNWRRGAERALDILGTQGLGMVAPETEGVDLDGNMLSLKDYRGQVVLVSFWAAWCAPCLEAIPHERELLKLFGTTEFAIVGMNADDSLKNAREAAKKHGITWRSIHTTDRRFVNNWTVSGYPTFCLLDKAGRIVGLWNGLPPDEELIPTIRRLIDAPK